MSFNCGKNKKACLEANGMPWAIKYNVPKPGYLEYIYPNEQPGRVLWTSSDLIHGCNDIYYYEFINDPAFTAVFRVSFRPSLSASWQTEDINIGNQAWEWIEPYKIYLNSRINIDHDREGFPSVTGGARGGVFYLWYRYKLKGQVQIFDTYQAFGYTGIWVTAQAQYIGLVKQQNPNVLLQTSRKKFWVRQNNTEVFSRIHSSCPQVQLVSCYLDHQEEKGIVLFPSQYKIFGESDTVLIVDYSDGIVKQARAELAPYPDTGERKTILALQSPPGCNLYPKICYHCNPCQRCPVGTVIKCCDRKSGKICCYDKNGKLLTQVDSQCEKCDC